MKSLLVFILLIAGNTMAEDSIRAFPISTLEKLGKELYLRDQMAGRAFDTLFTSHPEAKEAPIKGWITEVSKEHRRVYFVQERESLKSLAYVATFQDSGEPQVEARNGAMLPEFVAKRFKARSAAIEAIPKLFTERYNFEVMDAPDGKGFLVYGLASTTDPNAVVVGGHYRVSVSDDGKVQQVDALSRSFLVLPRRAADVPKDAEVMGLTMTHIVSDTPVETHVFVSLLHNVPFYVATSEKDVWHVSNGKISKADDEKR